MSGRDLHNIGVDLPGYWAASSRTFNAANEITNNFNLIGVTVGDFNVSEFIFDQYQQFQTIKPVDPEIVTEVRFVRNASNIDFEMLGNQISDFAYFQAYPSR